MNLISNLKYLPPMFHLSYFFFIFGVLLERNSGERNTLLIIRESRILYWLYRALLHIRYGTSTSFHCYGHLRSSVKTRKTPGNSNQKSESHWNNEYIYSTNTIIWECYQSNISNQNLTAIIYEQIRYTYTFSFM